MQQCALRKIWQQEYMIVCSQIPKWQEHLDKGDRYYLFLRNGGSNILLFSTVRQIYKSDMYCNKKHSPPATAVRHL